VEKLQEKLLKVAEEGRIAQTELEKITPQILCGRCLL